MEKRDDGQGRPLLPKGRGRHTVIGYLPPNDPIFHMGPIVAGRRIFEAPTPNTAKSAKTPEESGIHGCKSIGSLPPDHPIYKQGSMIFGTSHSTPPEKKEQSEKK